MSPTPELPAPRHGLASALTYAAFAAAVFWLQGSRPGLGSDHLTYIQVADAILASCPDGDFWRETNSIRFFSVLLAYLHGETGSHVLSMKLVLAALTVPFLYASERFFSLFTPHRWQAVLFALVSAFAVSFGFGSWGVTDSTALLPRTLVAPLVMFAFWVWLRFDGRPARYIAFVILALGVPLHLSVFYAMGVLGIAEIVDWFAFRRVRFDRLLTAFAGGVIAAIALVVAFEAAGLASRSIGVMLPELLRAAGVPVGGFGWGEKAGCRRAERATALAAPAAPVVTAAPAVTAAPSKAVAPAAPVDPFSESARAAPATAREAWAAELSLRPWRNMPLPLVNVANALSSSALILLLAAAGIAARARRGFTRDDQAMLSVFAAVPIFAFGPPSLLWLLRSFTGIYPISIEEVRAVGLVMVPALYFGFRLFEAACESRRRGAGLRAAAVVVAMLALPLAMKNLPSWTREAILSGMTALRVVDPADASRVTNARAALGLLEDEKPLYYATRGVRDWLERETPPDSRVLTERDDLVLVRGRKIIGPRQVTATIFKPTQAEADAYLETTRAMRSRSIDRVLEVARRHCADFAVVPWRVEGAAYADDYFSAIPAGGCGGAR